MKVSRIGFLGLGLAALTAGVVVFGAWNWKLHSEAEIRLGRAMILETRHGALSAEVAAGALRIQELVELVQGASNRISVVERLLEEEKNTHDPIRLQIEKMQAEQIGLHDALGKRDETVVELEARLVTVRKRNDALSVASDRQREQIAKLEQELKGANDRETVVQSKLGKAQAGASDLKVKLEDVLRRLAESERLVEELNKQKPVDVPVGTTNSAATASSP